jgi:hypothetical protein
VEKGTIFEINGISYKLQKITKDGVYASKVLSDGKCQRGRPSRLPHDEVAACLDISVDTLVESTLPKRRAPRPVELARKEEEEERKGGVATLAEPLPVRYGSWGQPVTPVPVEETISKEEILKTKEELEEEERLQKERQEKIAKLLDLIDDDSTIDDW